MTAFTFGGWTMGITLASLLNEARVLSRDSDYDHLGNDDATRQGLVADMVNRSIEDVLDKLIPIGSTTGTVNVVSGTQAYDFPSDMRQRDIKLIYLTDSSSRRFGPLNFISRMTADTLPPEFTQSEHTWVYPTAFSLNEDGTKFMLWPMPTEAYTATLLYRQQITSITQANVATPSGVTIGEIPKRAQKALALLLASELVEPIKPEQAALLRLRYWNDDPKQPGVMNLLRMELDKTLAATRSTNRLDHRDGLINSRRYFDGMYPLTNRRVI